MCAARVRVIAHALFHFYGMIIVTCQHTTKGHFTSSQAHEMRVIQPVSLSPSVVYLGSRHSSSVFIHLCIHASSLSSLGKYVP